MGRRLPSTPRSKVKQALRRLSLQSRERTQALKLAGYCCARCGIKQSRAQGREVYVEAHHRSGGIPWERLIDLVFELLLVPPEEWEILCKECHEGEHDDTAKT
jgi:hypothetical protein